MFVIDALFVQGLRLSFVWFYVMGFVIGLGCFSDFGLSFGAWFG